ncbi:hypothetical protein Q2T41_16945 [Maribacter confluentis]|uniref:Uncharacterized protein n=1 Tax=Maribacter confluentis TaxID=1656093 RepID=A0ABT8RTW2_9FLAO|nr:hypothetical protein [Maribacter confluentis]MDO1514344.1 hypothetical protein [Maribacter confluentis]
MYTKTKPDIRFIEFMQLASPVVSFNSLEGNEYVVQKFKGTKIYFKRETTKQIWDMDLKQVHKAYLELKDFKTINFKPYVPLTHSPALGLLLHLKLLVK